MKQDKIYLGFRTNLTPSHFLAGDNDKLIRQLGLKSFKEGQPRMPIDLADDVIRHATSHFNDLKDLSAQSKPQSLQIRRVAAFMNHPMTIGT